MEKQLLLRVKKLEKLVVDLYKKLRNLPVVTPYTPTYKVITGVVSCTVGGVASIVIQENTTGQTVTFSRFAAGRYTLSIGGNLLTVQKCWYSMTQDNNNQNLFYINYDPSFGNTSGLTIEAGRTDGIGFFDGSLINTPFEVRIYN